MAKRDSGDGWRIVRPGDSDDKGSSEERSSPPNEQRPRVAVEKRAKGKVVTVVTGLVLTAGDRKALAKKLKAACGTGGTTTDDGVELQGDVADRLRNILESEGYPLR